MKKALILCLVVGLCLISYLIWSAQALIPPLLVGVVFAYVFRPLKQKFHLPGIRHEVSVMLAFSFIVVASTLMVVKFKSHLPNDREEIELKIRLDYKLNEKFGEVFEGPQTSNFIAMLGKEIKPAVHSLSDLLALSIEEEDLFEKSRIIESGKLEKRTELYQAYHLKNNDRRSERLPLRTLASTDSLESGSAPPLAGPAEEKTHLLYLLSLWAICPLVFLFLIFDNGQIRRFFIGLVPNRYFEVTLTLVDRIDEALGLYLRGTATECFLVGISSIAGFIIIGISVPVAAMLGVFCGVLNAVPFLGPLIGALAILSYALIAESIHPMISMVNLDNLFIAALIVVGVVQILDNILFAPIVLGRAVNLHPLIVIISLSVSSMVFGVWGVVLTIPAVVVTKTIVETLVTQFKAYKLI